MICGLIALIALMALIGYVIVVSRKDEK
jgi:hypothetical protein